MIAEIAQQQEKTTQPLICGRGLLHVTAWLWERLNKPHYFDEWHTVLMLPDSYIIENIQRVHYYDVCGDRFILQIASETLPVVENVAHVLIEQSFKIGIENRVELACMGVRVWNGERWVNQA